MRPRLTLPFFSICATTALTMFTGTAKPMPTLPPPGAMIAVLMPTRLPLLSMRAPPELPGLMGASVWMKFS